jgi:hypothetical protein
MTAEERAKALLQEIEGRARVNRPFGVLRGQAVAEIASAIHSAEAEARQEAERERDDLRQAHWDARAAAGFDNDGDPTPRAVASDFAALIRSDWRSMQESLDESRAESDAAESALASSLDAEKKYAEAACALYSQGGEENERRRADALTALPDPLRSVLVLEHDIHRIDQDALNRRDRDYERERERAEKAEAQATRIFDVLTAKESALASAREALKAADAAMNHMGDVLNGMDAVEPEDEEKTGPAFALVRIALGEPMDGDEERARKASAPTGGGK